MRNGWIVLFALTVATGQAAEISVNVCNRMSVELTSITLTDDLTSYTASSALKPGECISLKSVGPGSYTLQFIERDTSHAALCRNHVTLKAGAALSISPDDGANCMM